MLALNFCNIVSSSDSLCWAQLVDFWSLEQSMTVQNENRQFALRDFAGLSVRRANQKAICGLYVYANNEMKSYSLMKLISVLKHFDTMVAKWGRVSA